MANQRSCFDVQERVMESVFVTSATIIRVLIKDIESKSEVKYDLLGKSDATAALMPPNYILN